MSTHDLTRIALTCSLALASACGSGDPLTGTWRQPDATTRLPAEYGGGDLAVDATLTFDGEAATPTFEMHLDLALEGLTDVVDAHGTYEDLGDELELTFEGFTIDPASGNTPRVADDGSQCITLMGFGGAEVCFPAVQTNPRAIGGETLTMTIDQAIAPAALTETQLSLSRVQ